MQLTIPHVYTCRGTAQTIRRISFFHILYIFNTLSKLLTNKFRKLALGVSNSKACIQHYIQHTENWGVVAVFPISIFYFLFYVFAFSLVPLPVSQIWLWGCWECVEYIIWQLDIATTPSPLPPPPMAPRRYAMRAPQCIFATACEDFSPVKKRGFTCSDTNCTIAWFF